MRPTGSTNERAQKTLQRWLGAARRRGLGIIGLALLPWLLASLALGGRMGVVAWWLLALLLIAGAIWALVMVRRLDTIWLARRLDARRADMEDSAALLYADSQTLPPLARLQRERLQQRVGAAATGELRPAWPRRALLGNALLALLLAAAAWFWPAPASAPPTAPPAATRAVADPTHTRITRQSLQVQPPAYTGLPARQQRALAATVPEGAQVRWTLRLSPQPGSAALHFHDGSRLPLQRQGEQWTAARRIAKATLYRVVPGDGPPLADPRLQRIAVIADRPPQIRVTEPERSLSLLEEGQKTWPLLFQASDDYGLGPAQLRITLAQGSGENIAVSARSITLAGTGQPTRRRYAHRLDLAALGFAEGDDVVVRLSVSDRRRPAAQTTRSASFILRWPPARGAEASGVEGLVKRTLPAYFRSQRQIIIDSEALLAQRRKLDADTYLRHSDAIGVDQRILRLRYGQFLGEQAADAPADGDHDEDHPVDPSAPMSATGDATSVLEAYGHTHDVAEAATLLDAQTRELLRAALGQMWQSELHLRQGRPDKALPYENAALRLIKQVQHASRIYLARVGLELPAIDEGRRLGGDRTGLQSRGDALVSVAREPSAALALWLALQAPDAVPDAPALQQFETWLRGRGAQLPQALDLFVAIDAWRQAPDCDQCRLALRGQLWPLLPADPPMPAPRPRADQPGRAYLDALQRESTP